MNKRVQTLLKNQGSDFFSRIGKKGFQVTCDRYFNGDREAMKRWLTDMGQWAIYHDLPYHKPAIERFPGLHPAHIEQQVTWLDYVERAISPDFPPFGENLTDNT